MGRQTGDQVTLALTAHRDAGLFDGALAQDLLETTVTAYTATPQTIDGHRFTATHTVAQGEDGSTWILDRSTVEANGTPWTDRDGRTARMVDWRPAGSPALEDLVDDRDAFIARTNADDGGTPLEANSRMEAMSIRGHAKQLVEDDDTIAALEARIEQARADIAATRERQGKTLDLLGRDHRAN